MVIKMNDNILEVKDLIISFRTNNGNVHAVRDINFELKRGETLAIVGESGSGKSVTSRAILGILAGNAIVEGGSIIYNGQDLLRIPEEEFHRIRGDKIAMIFQDPLSSLNPIVRIGKQLTEAMILKNKASRRRARDEFNRQLRALRENMEEALAASELTGTTPEKIGSMVKEFDRFNLQALELENKYNTARQNMQEVIEKLRLYALYAEKKEKGNYRSGFTALLKTMKLSAHPYLCGEAETEGYIAELKQYVPRSGKLLSEACAEPMKRIAGVLEDKLALEKPNFFVIGYYRLHHPEEDIFKDSVLELNVRAHDYIDAEFMPEFLRCTDAALKHADEKSRKAKREALEKISGQRAVFEKDPLDKRAVAEAAKALTQPVEAAIDPLALQKDSNAYTFGSSLSGAIEKYFTGLKTNPGKQADYDKQVAKYDAICRKGKNPDWKPVPPALVDLDVTRQTMLMLIDRIYASYSADLEREESDWRTRSIALVDAFKEKASAVVDRVTKSSAKAKAIRIMEEVGIPEPEKRYRQYPFEFSGGMRQRIVIAIALAANPDILICDEPTTALDVTIQSQILELINRLKEEHHLSVIFITHDLGVVANMADRIAVMYAGKIVEYGTSEDIFYDPRHPYTWALLSSNPDLDTKEKLEAIPGTPPNMIYPPKGDAFAARNKYALKIDFERQPPMFEISETHAAATWLLHPDAPKVEMPKIVSDRIRRAKERLAAENGDRKS